MSGSNDDVLMGISYTCGLVSMQASFLYQLQVYDLLYTLMHLSTPGKSSSETNESLVSI